jgi:hypothetical protein
VVPEDLLSEPTDGGMMDVCSDNPDVGLELSQAASRASSTLECGLRSQEAGPGCSITMEVDENHSALEVAAAENPVLRDSASGYPAPEGVAGNDPAQVGSASYNPAPEGAAGGDPAPMGSAGCNQPPRVSEWAPLLIPPWMSTSGLLLHILIVRQQHVLQIRESP